MNGTIYLARADAPLATVAHEVVHALQARRGSSRGASPQILPDDHPAEREAHAIARRIAAGESAGDRGAVLPGESLGGGVVALLRAASGVGVDEASGEQGAPSGKTEQAKEKPRTPGSGGDAGGQGGVGGPDSAARAAGGEPARPSPEVEAKRREEALKKLAGARDPRGLLDVYADAPPSQKARMLPGFGAALDRAAREEQSALEKEDPKLRIEVPGSASASAPPQKLVDPSVPSLDPKRDEKVKLAVDKGEASGKAPPVARDAVRALDASGTKEAPRKVEGALRDLPTTDPGLKTALGPRPGTGAAGASAARRMEGGEQLAVERTRTAADEARKSVSAVDPASLAKPRSLKGERKLAKGGSPAPSKTVAASGAQRFLELGVSDDVGQAFDRQQAAAMKDGLQGTRDQLSKVVGERDTARKTALDETEKRRSDLSRKTAAEQAGQVDHARRTIAKERGATLGAQKKEVAKLAEKAGKARAEREKSVKKRTSDADAAVTARYDKAEKDAKAEAAKGRADAEKKRKAALDKSKKESWLSKAASFVRSAFQKIAGAIQWVFDKVRKAVGKLFDAARAFAAKAFAAVTTFLTQAIAAFGTLLKAVVQHTLGSVFPGLARKLEAAIDKAVGVLQKAVRATLGALQRGLDGLLAFAQKALDKVLATFQAGLSTVVDLMGAALTGDWSGLAKKLLMATLGILGIDPKAFFAMVGEAEETLGLIVAKPMGFLKNCLGAVRGGFSRFGTNFLKHLKAGVISWLTGAFGGELTIPERFDLAGILDLVRQVLGLSWDWLKKKAARIVGEKNVARIEYLVGWVDTLRTEGWQGVFERIQEELAGLRDKMFEAIRNLLVTQVVMAVGKWLLSLFNPVAALVKIVMTIWNLIQFLREQLQRLMGIAQAVISSLSAIARGVLDAASAKVEEVLGRLMPVAIGLVARLMGVSGVVSGVRKLLRDVRARFDKAVDNLIGRVLRRFRKKPSKGAVQEPTPGKVRIGKPLPVPDGKGGVHHLSIDVRGKDAVPVMRSTERGVKQWLKEFDGRAARMTDEKKRKKAEKLIASARQALTEVDRLADALAAGSTTAGKRRKKSDPKPEKVVTAEVKLRDALVAVFAAFGERIPLSARYGPELDASHPKAHAALHKAFKKYDQDKLALESWKAVKAKLREDEGSLFRKPLHRSVSAFGKELRTKLDDVIAKEAARIDHFPESEKERDRFLRYLRSGLYGKEAPFTAAHDALMEAPFKRDLSGALSAIKAVLPEAFRKFQGSGKTTQNYRDAMDAAGGKVDVFLAAFAEGKKLGPIAPADFRKEVWIPEGNKKDLKGRFRGADRGKHEWIPTDMVVDVVEHAQKSGEAGSQLAGLRWVAFQHAMRSKTPDVVFKPEGVRRVEVTGVRAPKKKSGKAVVLQGHSGAVYAPVGGGAYQAKVQQQTVGQKAWHDEYRKAFASTVTPGDDLRKMREVIKSFVEINRRTLWDGKEKPSAPLFVEYYQRARDEVLPSHDGYSEISSRAQAAQQQIFKDLRKGMLAAKEVGK